MRQRQKGLLVRKEETIIKPAGCERGIKSVRDSEKDVKWVRDGH